jgi:GNAT superfamily N-acetyltransferase
MMYEDVICCIWQKHRKLIRVFLAKEGERIVGWSCALLPPAEDSKLYYVVPKKTKHTPIYTYVNRAYRGLNLGKRLLSRAANFSIKRRYKPTVFFWNEKSSSFFANMQESVSKLQVYDVSEWWELYE